MSVHISPRATETAMFCRVLSVLHLLHLGGTWTAMVKVAQINVRGSGVSVSVVSKRNMAANDRSPALVVSGGKEKEKEKEVRDYMDN